MTTVSDFIGKHREQLQQLWTDAVVMAPFAEGLSVAELAGAMPAFCLTLGSTANGRRARLTRLQQAHVERHLNLRLRQGATLNEILTDFSSLSQLLTELLGAGGGELEITTREMASLFAELNLACLAATKIFNEQLLEDEQPGKRFLRLLEAAVGHDGEQPGDQADRIALALPLVARALGAQVAGLVLFDEQSDELITSSAVGTSASAFESHAGLLARTEGKLELARLADGHPLRKSGIQVLLGVPVDLQAILRGVVYVGFRERARLTPGKARELETLGRALISHLAHARLRALLREQRWDALVEQRAQYRFTSMVVGDLSAGLARARSLAAELTEGVEDADASSAAGLLRAGIDRLGATSNALRDAYRMRAGTRIPLSIQPCDLAAVVSEAVRGAAVRHEHLVTVADDDVRGMWNRSQLVLALQHLVEAVCLAARADSVVTVSAVGGADVAEVAITGRDLSLPVGLELAAQRPWSVPALETTLPPGWGVALALLWSCIEAHGGALDIATGGSPEWETRMTLQLPLDARTTRRSHGSSSSRIALFRDWTSGDDDGENR